MYLDKKSAKELAESILWWENKIACAWNATLGRILGKQPLHEETLAPTLVLVEEDPTEED